MPTTNFESLRVYLLSEELAVQIWDIVIRCENFGRDTFGKQVVRSADSIRANLAEGKGRGSFQDNHRFIHVARGSLQETEHWLRRAFKRNLLTKNQIEPLASLIAKLSPTLNAYLRSLGTTKKDK